MTTPDGIKLNFSPNVQSDLMPLGRLNQAKQNAPIHFANANEKPANADKGTVVEKGEQKAEEAPKADLKLVEPTKHKAPHGFYPATSDKNPNISGKNGILANNGEAIKTSKDPAGTVAEAVISTKSDTAENAQMKNSIRQMIIKANPSVFEKDGSLKKDADLGKLDIPTKSHLMANVSKADPKRTVIPKGFYPAFKDGNGEINGLTETQLRQNKDTCGAVQILNALLKTKGTKLMAQNFNKAQLLNDLVRKNPSVFNANGSIKKDADFTKLDVPTLEYMEKTYKPKPEATIATTIGKNGYYAKGSGKNAKFYMANGQEITAGSFAKRCSTIYKQVIKEN